MSAQRAIVVMGVLSMGAWAQSAPSINSGGAINAASSAPGAPLAPGSIASVYGRFLLTSPSGAAGAPLPTSLSGLSQQFNGSAAAPLFYASSRPRQPPASADFIGSSTAASRRRSSTPPAPRSPFRCRGRLPASNGHLPLPLKVDLA